MSGDPPAPEAGAAPAPDGAGQGPAATLAAAAAEFRQAFPEEPPPPPPPAAAGGEEDDSGEVIETLAEEVGERIDVAAEFDEEELADTWALAFDMVADRRGEFWRLPERSSKRLGRWTFRVLKRHPDILEWVSKNLPDVVLALLVVVAIGERVYEDRRQHKAAAGEVAA